MPVLVPQVEAVLYYREMEGGATRPAMLACEGPDGASADYVVKLRDELGYRIICEFVAAQLAASFELPTPPIAVVMVSDELAAHSALQTKARRLAPGPHFGSLYLGESYQVLNGISLGPELMGLATRIFAFDALIQNVDRRTGRNGGKPNLLYNGSGLAMIDHEKAFSFLSLIGQPPPPWQLRGEDWVAGHLLYAQVRDHAGRNGLDLSGFTATVAGMSDSYLAGLMGCLPTLWHDARTISGISAHLGLVRDNAARFEQGLREALV